MHIHKNDTVLVISGNSRGKSGKVLRVLPDKQKVLVEGANIRKRHTKPSAKMQSGGILEREMPVDASDVMVVCPKCNKASRIGYATVAGMGGRKQKMRVCKNCNEMF
ncbi:MAG: 50S ribosomal protein L24 [Candidatus Kryptoniota bacterium]